MMIRAVLLVTALFAVGAACADASASNPLGFYIGGAVGHADVRSTLRIEVPTYEFEESDTGWKALVGLRPIRHRACKLPLDDREGLTGGAFRLGLPDADNRHEPGPAGGQCLPAPGTAPSRSLHPGAR